MGDQWASPTHYVDGVRGWYPNRDVAALLRFAHMADGATGGILELGAFEGRSALKMREEFPDRPILCVDMWANRTHYDRFLRNTAGQRIDSLRMTWDEFKADDSIIPAVRPIAVVHIDMDHTYDQVAEQIPWARGVIEPGGILVGHDYNPTAWPEVVRAVDDNTEGRLNEAHVWAWQPR